MNDQRTVSIGGFQRIVGLDLPALLRVFHGALRAAHVGIGDGLPYGIQRHALIEQRRRVQLDPHRRQRTAAHGNVADALGLADLLRQLGGGEIVKLPLAVGVRGQRQDHDRRVGRVDLAVTGAARHAGRQQALRGVDRRLHVARGAVDVAAEIELQNDPGTAERTHRGHFVNSGDAAQRALQRRRHRGRHGFRRGARQRRADRNHRKVHLRQRRHRQQAKADRAADGDGQRQQGGGHRPVNEQGEEFHGSSCVSGWRCVLRASLSNSR